MDLPPIGLDQHAAALMLCVGDVLARALRSRLLLPVSIRQALVINTCGDAMAAVTPARVGGEPLRYFGFTRAGSTPAATIAAFGSELVADTLILITAGLTITLTLASRASGLLSAISHLTRSPTAWGVLGLTLSGLAGSLLVFRRVWPRTAFRFMACLRESWRQMRSHPPAVMAGVVLLSGVSLLSRAAILPVLLARVPGLEFPDLAVAAFALTTGLLLAPIPAGAGAVDLGFVVGFDGRVPPGTLAVLLVAWRAYSLVVGALAGAVLLLRETLPGGLLDGARGRTVPAPVPPA
ncbi:MAG TPA: lysylphosphatidylglycerol synthase domain-containing protein [Gemmatimonadales bacterium]|jgi:hypothetical protein|nr:lysylphosphatidylglycerol synthase domain-containing protein [Gemmatimonadales bacterium]